MLLFAATVFAILWATFAAVFTLAFITPATTITAITFAAVTLTSFATGWTCTIA